MMKKKNIQKLLLLVAITILIVGIVSAAQSNKATVSKDNKVVKEAEIIKTETSKIINKKNIEKRTVNNKTASMKNIYVSSNGKGNGKSVKSPTNINKAISNIQNKGTINLVTNSKSDKYNTFITIDESKVKSNTKEFSIVGQKNKKITLTKRIKINGINVIMNNLIITDGVDNKNSKITVKNCNFENNKDISLNISYSDKSVITKNNFKNNEHTGIFINASDNCKITKNNFINNYAKAIETDHEGYYITNTFFWGGSSTTFITTKGFNLSISNNKFTNNTYDDSLIECHTDGIEVNGNMFTGNKNEILITSYGHDSLKVNKNMFKDNEVELKIICSCNENKVIVTNNIFVNNKVEDDTLIDIHVADEKTIKGNIYYYKNKKNTEIEGYGNKNKNINEKYYYTNIALKITPTKTIIGKNVKVTVTLKNNKKQKIKNQKITLKLGSKTYTVKTNSKGVATKNIKTTKVGSSTIIANYVGSTQYSPASKESKITVNKK